MGTSSRRKQRWTNIINQDSANFKKKKKGKKKEEEKFVRRSVVHLIIVHLGLSSDRATSRGSEEDTSDEQTNEHRGVWRGVMKLRGLKTI